MKAKQKTDARPARQRRGAWLVAIPAIILSLPLALIAASTVSDAVFVAVLVGGIALVVCAIGYALMQAAMSRRNAQPERVSAPPSADLRLVASRLISVEKRVAAIADPAGSNPAFAEMASDLGLLSSLVKGLADTLAEQEREISDLRGRVDQLSRRAAHSSLQHLVDPAATPPAALRPAIAAHHKDRDRLPRLFPSAGPDMHPDKAASSSPADRAALAEAARSGRIDLRLQPIVSLPQRHIRGYRMLSRLRCADGRLAEAEEYGPALRERGDLAHVDQTVLSRALAVATELEPASAELRLTCAIASPLNDGGETARLLEALLPRFPTGARRITLEFDATVWRSLSAKAIEQLGRMRAAGTMFSLGGFTEWSLEEALTSALRPDFIAVSRTLILTAAPFERVSATLGRLHQGGIRVIATGVEHEAEVLELLDFDILLGQGGAFGAARPLLPESAVATPAANALPTPTEPADPLIRLRDVVRRIG